MNKTKKNARGITLIALVITTIVLLILAGVAIAALSGDNGILTRAKEAKEKTAQAQKEEEKTLSNMENMLGVYNFKNVNKSDTNPGETVPENSSVLENDANEGIVIKDRNNNEWVWVEVPKTTVFSGLNIDVNGTFTSQNYTDIANKMITYAGVYRKGSVNQECNWTDEWYDGCGLTQQAYIKAYQSMLKGVYTYGGFWIGRYEAGIDGSITDLTKARTTHTTVTIGTSPKAISQKDAIPYNFVYCSEAQMLANEMTPDSNYRSSLMFGIQWDLVCKFLEVKSNLTTADINSDSGSWGNYSNIARKITSSRAKQSSNNGMTWTSISGQKESKNIMLSTGASDDTNRLNIYDFAGNEWEWTLEKSSESLPCSGRGGSCGNTTNGFVTSARNEADVEGNDNYASFRPTLYKK